jgi:hypothetical protein
MQLQAAPGFDWAKVAWSRPDSSIVALCSYCFAGMPEETVPLVVWKDDGHMAHFCDTCMRRWWGMR